MLFLPSISSIEPTEVLQKESEEDPRTTRGRHAAGGEMDFAVSSHVFDVAR